LTPKPTSVAIQALRRSGEPTYFRICNLTLARWKRDLRVLTHAMRDAVAVRNPLRPFLPDSFFSVLSEIASAWIEGPKTVRAVIAAAIFLGIAALILHVIGIYRFLPNAGFALVSVLGILAGAALTIVVVYRDAKKTAAAKAEYEAVEQRARENPDEPSAAWDLARIKLQRVPIIVVHSPNV
jgi:hypothetical protein